MNILINNIIAPDTIFLQHNGYVYLFTNNGNYINIYYAKSLYDKFISHPINFKSVKTNILPLYNKIVFLTRESFFYKDFKLSDSFSNRIYLIFFHLCFILISLKNKKSDKNDQQTIFNFFFKQIELNCRELGYGDMTVNKKMKDLIKLFYEILIQCHNWKQLEIDEKNE